MTYKNPIPSLNGPRTKSIKMGKSTCGCCSKPNVLVHSTSYTDLYCKDCLKLVIKECKEAIKEIEEYETGKVRRVTTKITKKELTELEKEKDLALAKLMQEKMF